MNRSIRRILYVSRIGDGMNDDALRRIVAGAQIRNRRTDVSGVLAVGAGMFAQVIEGWPTAIGETFKRIASDDRHREVKVIEDTAVEGRIFDRWSMELLFDDASVRLASNAAESLAGGAEFIAHLRARCAGDPVLWSPSWRGLALAS